MPVALAVALLAGMLAPTSQALTQLENVVGKHTFRPYTGTFPDGEGYEARFRQTQHVAIIGNTAYVSGIDSFRIRKIDLKTEIVSHVVGAGTFPFIRDGTALNTRLHREQPMTVVGTDIYFAERYAHMVRKLTTAPTVTTDVVAGVTFAGDQNGVGTNARFRYPTTIQAHSNHLYVVDSGNKKIRSIRLSDNTVSTIGSAFGSEIRFGSLCHASPMYVYEKGYVTSVDLLTGAKNEVGRLEVDQMRGMACNPNGYLYYVSNFEMGEFLPGVGKRPFVGGLTPPLRASFDDNVITSTNGYETFCNPPYWNVTRILYDQPASGTVPLGPSGEVLRRVRVNGAGTSSQQDCLDECRKVEGFQASVLFGGKCYCFMLDISTAPFPTGSVAMHGPNTMSSWGNLPKYSFDCPTCTTGAGTTYFGNQLTKTKHKINTCNMCGHDFCTNKKTLLPAQDAEYTAGADFDCMMLSTGVQAWRLTTPSCVRLAKNGNAAWGGLDSEIYKNFGIIQERGAKMGQTLRNLNIGRKYRVNFLAAARPAYGTDQRFDVKIDSNTILDDAAPPLTGFQEYTLFFTASKTMHQLTIQNDSPPGVDRNVFIQNLHVEQGTGTGATFESINKFTMHDKGMYYDVQHEAVYIADNGLLRKVRRGTLAPTSAPTITAAPTGAPTYSGPWKGKSCHEHPTRLFEQGHCQPPNYIDRGQPHYPW